MKLFGRNRNPYAVAFTLFVALVVVWVAQMSWWIYATVRIADEQLEFYRAQTRGSAELAAVVLNRSYDRLRSEAQSMAAIGNEKHLVSAFDLLLNDPAVLGYTLHKPDATLLAAGGVTDSSFYTDVTGAVHAVLFLDPNYPVLLTTELSRDLVIDSAARFGEIAESPFQASHFQIKESVEAELEKLARRRLIMFGSEGAFFVILTLLGAYMIYRALRQSEQLKRQQENFVHAVTHELKIPIASIKLYLETMLAGKVEPDKTKSFIPRMLDDCRRLDTMVDNVLEAGRHDNHAFKANLVRTNLSADLEEYLNELHPMIKRNNVRLRFDAEPELYVRSDYHALRRVVTALVDNAIKYSPEDRRELLISAKKVGRWCHIVFADKGVGVEAGEQKRVFERFYRTGSENTRTVPGTGIGLFLVRQIVEEHGGSVELHSEGLDRGTTVTVKLPLDSPWRMDKER